MFLLILGVALLGLAFLIVGRALLSSRMNAVQNVTGIGQYGFSSKVRVDDAESRSIVNDLAGFLGEVASGRLGARREAELRQHLISAGMYTVSPRTLLGYELIGAVGLPALWLYITVSGKLAPAIVIVGAGLMGALGWTAPVSIVQRRAKQRLGEIDYALPELIDLIVVSLEAGVGFTGSIDVASDRIKGPLGQELRLASQEQRMGLTITEALENFQKRCPTDTVRTFVRSIVQGERLGVSMGQIMRSLAVEMRQRRRALAEEKAHKAPVKMLFPLVFMIFPAMFVVLLGPAMYQILHTLNGK